jgi:hypothetical protein
MAKSVEIPQDIIDNVIAAVGDDRDLLKQCTSGKYPKILAGLVGLSHK